MKNKLLIMCILFSIVIQAEEFEDIVTLEESTITENISTNNSFFSVENKNTYLITQEKIQEKKYKNVEEVLRDAPGVIIQNTAFGPKVDMRGSGDKSLSRVKVLVDGISINPTEESMASLPINSIPVESIKKIEIIPGGGATLYGSGSVGGVINISTNSNATKNNFFMDLNYGSFDSRDIGFAGGYNLNKDLYVNYGFNYTNSEGYRENEQNDNKIFLGGFDYKINKNHKIRYQGRRGNEINDGTNEVSKKILEINRTAPGLNLDIKTKTESNVLDYEYRITDKLVFGTTLFNQKQNRKFKTESIDDVLVTLEWISKHGTDAGKDYYNFVDTKSLMDANFKEVKNGARVKLKYDYDYGDILFGYDYDKAELNRKSYVRSAILKTYNDGNPKDFNSGTHKLLDNDKISPIVNRVNINLEKESHGIYIFNKYDITKKLNFITGVRGEFTSYNGERKNGPNEMPMVKKKTSEPFKTNRKMENYAGELGALYKYRDTGNIYTRYERGFVTPFPAQLTDKIKDTKLPKLIEFGGPGSNNSFRPPRSDAASIYVDNNLKAETTDTIELGIRDFIGNTYMSMSLFMTDTTDEIVLLQSGVTNPAIKRWQYKNIGKTRRMGIEFESEQSLGKFNFNQNLTLINAKVLKGNQNAQIEKGDKIPLVPKAKVVLGVNYELTNNLKIGTNYTYISAKTSREMTDTNKSFEYTTKGYGVTDLSLTYKLDEYSSLRAGIKNLTSTKYNLRETSKEAVPAAERNYYLGLNVKF